MTDNKYNYPKQKLERSEKIESKKLTLPENEKYWKEMQKNLYILVHSLKKEKNKRTLNSSINNVPDINDPAILHRSKNAVKKWE